MIHYYRDTYDETLCGIENAMEVFGPLLLCREDSEVTCDNCLAIIEDIAELNRQSSNWNSGNGFI